MLPGDEKADTPPVDEVKVTESTKETGAGDKADAKAAEHVAPSGLKSTTAGQGTAEPAPIKTDIPKPDAPDPTEDRPDRAEREGGAKDTAAATEPEEKDA